MAHAVAGQFPQWTVGATSLTAPDISQNVPNALYNTETGINYDAADPIPPINPPAGIASNGTAPTGTAFNSGGSPGAGGGTTGISSAGEVSQGTRFAIRFSGIPIGSNPSVPLAVDLHTGAASIDNDTGVIVQVCGLDAHGQGAGTPCTSTGAVAGTSLVPVDANGNGIVFYEVAFADPNALEFANVIVYVNPTVSLNANPPVGGTPQVGVTAAATASFAPFYATSFPGVGAAQKLTSGWPIPRFVDNPLPATPVTLFTYGKCACDMLFPWVVGNSAINTSIVVANTSLDPCNGTACSAGFTAATAVRESHLLVLRNGGLQLQSRHFRHRYGRRYGHSVPAICSCSGRLVYGVCHQSVDGSCRRSDGRQRLEADFRSVRGLCHRAV